MKKFYYLIFLSVLVFTSCDKAKTNSDCGQVISSSDCIDTSLIDPNILCPDNLDPVCGCDGVTYGNGCYAFRLGVTSYTEGPCCE